MFSFFGNSKAASEAAPAPTPPQSPPAAVTVLATPQPQSSSFFSERSVKQLGLFFAGAGFFTLSTIVTRRAIARKRIATIPKFYESTRASTEPATKTENPGGGFLAVEALNLATLNVMSFFMMMTGGAAWAFDISNLEDLRQRARKSMGPADTQADEEAERQAQEWLAMVWQEKSESENAEAEKQASSSKPKGGRSWFW